MNDLEPDRQKVRRLLATLQPGEGLESYQIAERTGLSLRRVRPELTALYRQGSIHRSASWWDQFSYTWLYGPKGDHHRLHLPQNRNSP